MLSLHKKDCFTVEWKISNFSRVLSAKNFPLRSPFFKTHTSQGITCMRLLVYYSNTDVKFEMIIYEGGSEDDRYEISILNSSGKLKVPLSCRENNILTYSIENYDIFGSNSYIHLLQDTLTVCCSIWQQMIKPERRLFHTVLQTVNFSWNIENFCTIDKFNRTFHQNDKLQIIAVLYTGFGDGTHRIRLETQPNVDGFPVFVNCKLSSKSDRCNIISKNYVNPAAGWEWDIEIEDMYEDIVLNCFNLNLEFESLVAIEMNYQSLSTKDLPPTSNSTSAVASDANPSCSLMENFLLLYREGLHSDVTLKAEEKEFAAHKSILAARSPVFRSMFEKEQMSENVSGVVDIKDVDSETLDRMLIFLYSSNFEEVEWEDALALYYAADKYAIHLLKLRCTDILVAGVNVSNVCHLLVLADNHVDEQLIRLVVDFIRDHDEVISSAEWTELEEQNSKLTTKVLRELYLSQRPK